MINRNVIFPFIVILFSACAFWAITQFEMPRYGDSSVGAGFFPTIIVVMQVILCLILIFQALKKKDVTNKELTGQETFFSKTFIFSIISLIGYAVLIYVLGYLYASIIGFGLYLVYFRITNKWYYISATAFVWCVYYLFGQVFYISLPEGLWM